jgi:PAS domain S-box-containing protein
MAEPLRIIILEDNPADIDLIKFELEEVGLAFTSKVVMTEEDFIREIQDYCPDLILSDYDLPRYNGALALAEANRRCPDTPFILVTGAVSEDRAIEILTQGAKDYVLKKLLQQRLGPAIRRALTEAEEHRARKQAEEALHESHRTLEERVKTRTAALEAEMAARKKTQEALRESEEQFRTLANSIPNLAWWANGDGYITWYNQRWYDYTGTTPDQMEGWGWQSVHDPIMLPKVLERWTESLATGQPFDMEFPLRGADGIFRTFLTRVMPLKDSAGKVLRWFGTNTDISALKHTEEALQDSEKRYRRLFESAKDGILILDADTGKVVDVNPFLLKLLGYSRDALYGKHIWELGAFKDIAASRDAFKTLQDTEYIRYDDLPLETLDGRSIDVEFVSNVYPVDHHKVVQCNIRDISRHKRAEQQLSETSQRLQALMQAVPVGVSFSDDATCQRITGNPAVLEQFEVSPVDNLSASAPDVLARGRQIMFFRDGCRISDSELPLQRAVAENEVIAPMELEVKLPSGRSWFTEASGAPVRDAQGNVIAGIAVTVDITERKRMENALRDSESREKARAAELQAFLDAVPGIVFIAHDPECKKMTGNRATDEFLQLQPQANVSKSAAQDEKPVTFRAMKNGVEIRPEELPVQQAARGRDVRDYELDIVFSDGVVRTILGNASPVFDENGGTRGSIGVFMDVTELKVLGKVQTFLAQTSSGPMDEPFFNTLARYLAETLSMDFICIDRLDGEGLTARTVAVWCDGHFEDNVTYALKDTPCGEVVGKRVCCFPASVCQFFPRDQVLHDLRAESYVGVTLFSHTGRPIGLIAAIGRRPLDNRPLAEAVLKLVATRAAGEMERQDTEEALHESERFLKETQAVARLGGWKANPKTDLLIWTEGVYNLIEAPLDYKPNFADGLKLFAPKYMPIIEEDLLRTLETNEPFFEECEVITTSGKQFWVEVRGLASVREDETSYVVGTIQDISRRKQAEEALRENEERLRAITNHTPDHILMQDLDLRYQLVINPQLGLTEADMLGKTDDEILEQDDAERLTAIKRTVLETGDPVPLESSLRNSKGETEYFAGIYVPKFGLTGQIDGIIGYFRNITKRKHAEMALQERTRQLEDANKELESFSYSVSHDLRAPLRAIDGYARMILNQQGDKFDEDTQRKFDVIRNSAKTMGQLIDDLLALSRLGKEALSLSRLNVEELTGKVWEELKANNPDRSIDMRIGHLPPGMGDWSLIKQVLVNILSNAMKFTRVREVPLIEVGGYEERTEVVYYVRDNGVGFDMQYHDNLFGVFKRLHSAAEYEGTGVGLAIVQRIINKHGGRVWAEGEAGKGATFYFTLPTPQ